jgi:hypothetical protein
MRREHGAPAALDLHKPPDTAHLSPLLRGCVMMKSLHVSMVPALVAFAIIGYSLFVAYA